jgi:hypothetical protein
MASPDKESKKLFMVGTVSLAIGIAFGLLSQSDFSSKPERAQSVPSAGLDRALVIKHCQDALQAIERAGSAAGDVSAGFASKYQHQCER